MRALLADIFTVLRNTNTSRGRGLFSYLTVYSCPVIQLIQLSEIHTNKMCSVILCVVMYGWCSFLIFYMLFCNSFILISTESKV